MLDVEKIREDYPALKRLIGGKPIIYFDSAATALKPQAVIDAVCKCYYQGLGNVGRGVHLLAEEAQEAYDRARRSVADFIGANPEEILFTRNSTDAINLIAASLPDHSRILSSEGEHHSNMLPWRAHHNWLAARLLPDGRIDLDSWRKHLQSSPVALCSVSHVSNATGAIQPLSEIISASQSAGALTLVDASQSVGHFPVDVGVIGCDFLCFSGHKIGGPTGVGVCYVRREAMNKLKPVNYGGGMVKTVTANDFELAEFPQVLEAGTPAIEAAVGLEAAVKYLSRMGLEKIRQHERSLTRQALLGLAGVAGINVVGPTSELDRGPIVAFHVERIEAHGVARLLSNRFNMMLRSGFHCAQPLHARLGWRPTVRASFSHYNSANEVQQLLDALGKLTT